ncbi:hypothetical protein [Terrarubrum flagellatum]|uniref:hypothetical protein n=1 Tax=Terrirubrum flagellatum TaxID=2895980 RepID=UPI0031453D2F
MDSLAPFSVAFALTIAAALSPVAAQTPVESVYTRLDLYGAKKLCKKTSGKTSDEEFGPSWRCSGAADISVFIHTEDIRDYVGFGRGAKSQTNMFGVGAPGAVRDTVEWRGRKDAKGKFAPYAAITRMGFENANAPREEWWSILVITRLAPNLRGSCVIARVDSRANEDANELARRVADAWATNERTPCPGSSEDAAFVGRVEGKWRGATTVPPPPQ